MSQESIIDVTINHARRTVSAPPSMTLLEMLRSRLGLTGTKECCAEGECGACTVIMDGDPVNSCLVLAVETEGSVVTTIEGVGNNGMTYLQESFLDAGAVQCGFCIPGMVVAATALLERTPEPSANEVRDALSGNLCRCGGYDRICDAVLRATSGARHDA